MNTIISPRPDLPKYPDAADVVARLVHDANLGSTDRAQISATAADLVTQIRKGGKPGLMEVFLAEYGLSTDEGIALMCLAEALLRVPDADTIDALIEDKIAPSDWGRHLGQSASPLVNASTWALMLTGRVLDEREPGIAGALRGAMKRLGEPVIRTAARQAMREMGQQFVLGQTMDDALERAAKMEKQGYTYSYDMLGEAARTAADARRYRDSYAGSIAAIARAASGNDVRTRPGISVKLSALHPRYEVAQKDRVMDELVPRLADLAAQAADAQIGLNIDAEEADRLELSLDVIEAVLQDERLAGWDGFGVVVQAYGPRAAGVIDHLYTLAGDLDRRLMVRLVKGAYWDTEVKHAQILGMNGFPVFTDKAETDVSYIACARKLLSMTDRLYPQFATHNAHSAAAILHLSDDPDAFEFQRLHGMGERLHQILMDRPGNRCRIYAPVGAHRDLLAYLVRRLLENGANSSFVNQIVDEDVTPEEVATDPFDQIGGTSPVRSGANLYAPERANSNGWDLTDSADLARFDRVRAPFAEVTFTAEPRLATGTDKGGPADILNPADGTLIGHVHAATDAQIAAALDAARPWHDDAATRARVLNRAADLYEARAGEIFAILAREAGKTPLDAVGELREAVDFLRYYATQTDQTAAPLGVITAISPWNFPLAIFTGQIAGALAAGNGVLAKPAEQTPLIADLAVRLMWDAGVPPAALQLLPGDGATVGAALTSDPRVAGVAFTGSTATAHAIRRAMAEHLDPGAPLLAETGGLNAMIVDSTALLEQAVRDVVQSAFQSAGQRCSALRCVYVQRDIAPAFREMLFGAMDELRLGDPWHISTDVGPVIDQTAAHGIATYIDQAGDRTTKRLAPHGTDGHFIPPAVVEVAGIDDLDREIFGPVLHMATFEADSLPKVIERINASGYGLTFGLHTRIDNRVQEVSDLVTAGNVYVNRNQIGAVVGTQPFGGEGLSGTGPKAGGPAYIHRFTRPEPGLTGGAVSDADPREVQHQIDLAHAPDATLDARDMPGPTGEANRLTTHPRAPFLCLGPGAAAAEGQAAAVRAHGTPAVAVAGLLDAGALTDLAGFGGVLWWGDDDQGRAFARALAQRPGAILPLITGRPRAFEVVLERHLCIDTTASGGNAQLLAEVGGP